MRRRRTGPDAGPTVRHVPVEFLAASCRLSARFAGQARAVLSWVLCLVLLQGGQRLQVVQVLVQPLSRPPHTEL